MDGPHRHAARVTIGTGNGILPRKRHGLASLEAPAWRGPQSRNMGMKAGAA